MLPGVKAETAVGAGAPGAAVSAPGSGQSVGVAAGDRVSTGPSR